MLLFLMDVDFECDWILIQIFYVSRFVGRDADAYNQHSWHHTSHIEICKLLIVSWSTRAWFLDVWDPLQLFEKRRLGISWCSIGCQDPLTVCAQSQIKKSVFIETRNKVQTVSHFAIFITSSVCRACIQTTCYSGFLKLLSGCNFKMALP